MNTQFPLPSTGHAQDRTLASDLLERFSAIVGAKYAITNPAEQEPYLVEGRGLYHGRTPVVLRPGSVARGCRHRAACQ